MNGTSPVCLRIPAGLLLQIDERVFERRKCGARAASRTAVIVDLLAEAVNPVANSGETK